MIPLPGMSMYSFSLACRMSLRTPAASVTVLTTAFSLRSRLCSESCSLVAVPRARFVSTIGMFSSLQISSSVCDFLRSVTPII